MSLPTRTIRRGFTFIHLLVVLGILAFLISILLPSLCRSSEQANRIKCTSNLRQIGLALDQYRQENGGRFPRTRFDDSDRPVPVFYTRPEAANPFAVDGPEANDVTASLYLLLRWEVTSEVMTCPAAPEERSLRNPLTTSNFADANSLSYSYQNPYTRKFDETTKHKPDEFAVMADINPGVPELLTTLATAPRADIIKINSPNHGGDGQNVLYEDGHVQWQTSPFAGVKRSEDTKSGDNIYLAGEIGAASAPTIIAAPADAIDTILLPVSTRGTAARTVSVKRVGDVREIVWMAASGAAIVGLVLGLAVFKFRRSAQNRSIPSVA